MSASLGRRSNAASAVVKGIALGFFAADLGGDQPVDPVVDREPRELL